MLRDTGCGRICTRSVGAPTFSSAPRISSTVALVLLQPAGEGAITIALAPLSAIMVLLTGVAAGLVDGVIAATTPTGLPYLMTPCPVSFSMTPTVRTRIRSRNAPKVLRWFLIILSATLPIPVSLTESSARCLAFSGLYNDQATAVTISSTRAWSAPANCRIAARALSISCATLAFSSSVAFATWETAGLAISATWI
jgi:hypothetical protein